MARNRLDTKLAFVYTSGHHPRQEIGARTVNKEQLKAGIASERGLTGYHFIIRRSGAIELGRDQREIGQHKLGRNDVSLGILLIGGADREGRACDTITPFQKSSLEILIRFLTKIYPLMAYGPGESRGDGFDFWAWQKDTFHFHHALQVKAIEAYLDAEAVDVSEASDQVS